MSEWKLYLDESGNTGTNVLDKEQPFYVYAGWLIKSSEESNAVRFVEESFKGCNAKELKSVNILKRNHQRQQLYIFLQNSIKNGLYPFYYVFEKKYYISCKIIETFFDYVHNSNVPMNLTFNFDRKKEICDAVYKNKELLKLFSCLIADSTTSIEKMRQIRDLLVDSLYSLEMLDYKDMIVDVTDEELYRMIDEFECVAEEDKKIRQSPGATELFSLVYEVEKLMKINNETVNIIVDELRNKTFINDLKNIINNHSVFNKVINLETEKSKNNIMLQAADLLSGYIYAIFKGNSIIVGNKESQKVISIFDIYNKEFLKYNVCPLKFASCDF